MKALFYNNFKIKFEKEELCKKISKKVSFGRFLPVRDSKYHRVRKALNIE